MAEMTIRADAAELSPEMEVAMGKNLVGRAISAIFNGAGKYSTADTLINDVPSLSDQAVSFRDNGIISEDEFNEYGAILTVHASQAYGDPTIMGGEFMTQKAYEYWVDSNGILDRPGGASIARALQPGSLIGQATGLDVTDGTLPENVNTALGEMSQGYSHFVQNLITTPVETLTEPVFNQYYRGLDAISQGWENYSQWSIESSEAAGRRAMDIVESAADRIGNFFNRDGSKSEDGKTSLRDAVKYLSENQDALGETLTREDGSVQLGKADSAALFQRLADADINELPVKIDPNGDRAVQAREIVEAGERLDAELDRTATASSLPVTEREDYDMSL